ncbi:MAG: NUDIX domain-containing protein [Spirochaetaceae bacterium]|jgi:mutator protein MutT|nr:NUDIX domain-containing protein [Spirochaetaceae bacterium]
MKRTEFTFCPQCGQRSLQYRNERHWICPECGFDLYHNVAAAVGVVLEINGKLLTVVRKKDPARGLLALPGGFIDPGERAEDAVLRECREEIGIEPQEISFLCTFPNTYEYKGITYRTCDIYFTGTIQAASGGPLPFSEQDMLSSFVPSAEEVSGFVLITPDEIEAAPIAFDSLRKALMEWRVRYRQGLPLRGRVP